MDARNSKSGGDPYYGCCVAELYHSERNHQGLGNRLIMPDECHAGHREAIRRRERLGGMPNYYYRAAA
jgi:hypothetical protein